MTQGFAALHPGLFSCVPYGNFANALDDELCASTRAVFVPSLRDSESCFRANPEFRCASLWAILVVPSGNLWLELEQRRIKNELVASGLLSTNDFEFFDGQVTHGAAVLFFGRAGCVSAGGADVEIAG